MNQKSKIFKRTFRFEIYQSEVLQNIPKRLIIFKTRFEKGVKILLGKFYQHSFDHPIRGKKKTNNNNKENQKKKRLGNQNASRAINFQSNKQNSYAKQINLPEYSSNTNL